MNRASAELILEEVVHHAVTLEKRHTYKLRGHYSNTVLTFVTAYCHDIQLSWLEMLCDPSSNEIFGGHFFTRLHYRIAVKGLFRGVFVANLQRLVKKA